MYLIYCHSQRKTHFLSSVPEMGRVEAGSFKTHWCVCVGVGLGNTSESEDLWKDLGQVNFSSGGFPASLETWCQSFHSLIEAAILGGMGPPCSIPGLEEKVFLCVLPASLPTPCTKLMDLPDLIPCLALPLGYGGQGSLLHASHAPAGLLYVAGAAGCALPACPMVNVGQWKSLLSSWTPSLTLIWTAEPCIWQNKQRSEPKGKEAAMQVSVKCLQLCDVV